MFYDVVIVGTGPSAASAYASLKEKNPTINVCLLEAGDEKQPYKGSLAVKTSSRFRLNPSIYIGAGGTSELWHYVLAPFDPIDFEARPELGSPGWGISYEDLVPNYERVLRLLGVSDPQIFSSYRFETDLEKLGISQLLEKFEPKLYIQLKKRWQSIRFLRNQNANILYRHFVKSFTEEAGKINIHSVNFAGETNPIISASKLVICAGGLSTPQIVYNSDIIPEIRRHLGKTLLDHPMGVGMQLKRESSHNFEILTSKKTKNYNKKLAFRLKESVQRSENLPNSSYYFKPAFKEGYSEFTEDLKNKVLTYRNHLKHGKLPIGMSLELAREWNLVAQIIQYKTGLLSKTDLFDIFCVTEQVSRNSHIEFEKDDSGYYVGKCVWGVDRIDQQFNNKILKFFEEWITTQGIGSEVTVPAQDVLWTDRAVSAAHHIGTVPMSKDVETGCVNTYGGLFGLEEKVFIADSSVMPSGGCANVTLTSMALANRTGEHIAKTL